MRLAFEIGIALDDMRGFGSRDDTMKHRKALPWDRESSPLKPFLLCSGGGSELAPDAIPGLRWPSVGLHSLLI